MQDGDRITIDIGRRGIKCPAEVIFRKDDGRTILVSPVRWPKQTFWVSKDKVLSDA